MRLLIPLTLLFILVLAAPTFADPITITATASGSCPATPLPYPTNSVICGDFTYTLNLDNYDVVGDGNGDRIFWTFDFSGHPNYGAFSHATTLLSAMLTLTLTPQNGLVSTNVVWIESLPWVTASVIQALPVGVERTVLYWRAITPLLLIPTGKVTTAPGGSKDVKTYTGPAAGGEMASAAMAEMKITATQSA